eukprot:1142759-Pelagomonas_calceolata.AAC.8
MKNSRVLCSPNAQADDASGLLFEERLERAEQRRVQGNQLFAEGRYQEALSKYAVVGAREPAVC